MAKWQILGKAFRYSGGAANSADQIAYGFKFDVRGQAGDDSVHVEVMEGAPRTSESEARNALKPHLGKTELPRVLRARDGTFYPTE